MKWIILVLALAGCAHNSPVVTENLGKNPKLCFFGDSGTDWEIQIKVAKKLAEEKCDSLHVVGDVIYPVGLASADDPLFEKNFFKHYRPILEAAPFPKIKLVMGNHDHRGSLNSWMELAKRHPSIVFPYPYFLNRIGDICVVHLDSNFYRRFFDMWQGVGQSNWLRQLKENELKTCRVKIAIAHHPYLSSGTHHGNSTGLGKYIYEQEVIGSFDWFIAGHDHILRDEGTVRGTRLIVTGAAGKPDPGEKGGYLVWQNGETVFRTVD